MSSPSRDKQKGPGDATRQDPNPQPLASGLSTAVQSSRCAGGARPCPGQLEALAVVWLSGPSRVPGWEAHGTWVGGTQGTSVLPPLMASRDLV